MDPDVSRHGEALPYTAFAVASLIWGTTFLAIRLGNATVPPVWAATLRLALAAPLLFALVFALNQRFPRGAALRAALGYGALNFGVNLSLLYWGEVTIKSGIAAVFYATIPLSTFLFAWMAGLERPTLLRVAGGLLAVAGVATVFAGELTADAPPLGMLAILGAATAAALSGVILKRGPVQDAIPANAVGALAGAVVCLAVSFALGESHAPPQGFEAWWPIVYLTLFGSLGAYLLWTWLLKTWRASSASMVAVVVPVVAVLVGAVLAAERPAPLALVGAALVLVGVLVVLRSPHDAAPRAAPAVAAEPAPASRR